MKLFILIAGLFLGLFASTGGQAEGRRVALVIGNGAYQHLEPLTNPKHDAADLARALEGLGYEVTTGVDLDQAGFKAVTRDFLSRLKGADAALFFYAGHGVQVDNNNFLLPLDAELKSVTDIVFDAVPLQEIVGMMEREARTTVVLLDSCRDNPLMAQGAGSQPRGLTASAGLAPQGGAAGTYVAFAAQPGRVSLDGAGRNSPFTAALLKHLPIPGVDIRLMMADVRQSVVLETAGKQTPWENSSLTGRFSVNPAASPANAAQAKLDAERDAWEKIVGSPKAADFIDFLDAFPNGVFASTARSELRRAMGETQVAQQEPAEAAQQDPAVPGRLVILDIDEAKAREAQADKPSSAEAPPPPPEQAAAASPAPEPVSRNAAPATPAPVADQPPTPPAVAPVQPAATAPAAAAANPPAQPPAATAPAAPAAAPPGGEAAVAAIDPASPPAAQPLSEADLLSGAQSELIRLGCLRGSADGVWGAKSREALGLYAVREGLTLASLQPDKQILDRLRGETARACPLACSAREVVSGDRCVARTCDAGKTLTASGQCRTIERTAAKPRVQAERPRRKAAPVQRVQKVAPPSKPKRRPVVDYCFDQRSKNNENCE